MIEFDTKYLYTITFFSSAIGLIVFLGLMLGVVYFIIKLFNRLVLSIFGKEGDNDTIYD
jgi:hypothetical protein